MRITEHPILDFQRGEEVPFFFDEQEFKGFAGETIAAALHAAGVRVLGHSHIMHRPRGIFCAIGNCSSCLMVVDGQPNIRICVEKLQPGMRVETQQGKGVLK